MKKQPAKKIKECFIRYPGNKAKLYHHIYEVMPDFVNSGPLFTRNLECYCEPFFGSGAIGWRIMRHLRSGRKDIVINDKDLGIASLWKVVRDCPLELIELIRGFQPTKEKFYEFKERDGVEGIDIVQRAFEKLVLHQTSFSGLGVKAGGPLGGKEGRSEYNVDCRWKMARLIRGITACHTTMKRMRSVEVYCFDFSTLLSSKVPENAFVYLDPPYYKQGESLYKHHMKHADHERLATILQKSKILMGLQL